ncbi:hypothetical protein LNP74_24915 [Klebsiella pneumoniae subsp. pneumoniae]|nr:hypothetical protein [Klebsiella pneumoniae subsp. pneumoniae]
MVTGAVVMAIWPEPGADCRAQRLCASAFDSWMAVLTVLCIGIVAVLPAGCCSDSLILVRPDRRLRAVRPAG